jgi:hypothetical protein
MTSRRAAIVVSAVIIVLLSVILFSVRQNILTYDNTSETIFFILTVVIAYGIGSWLLLGYVKQTSRTTMATRTTTTTTTTNTTAAGNTFQKSPVISLLRIAVVMVQFAMLGIMLYVIFDRTSEYLMPYVNAVTSGFATIILGVFAYKFANWYKLSNKKLVVLLYFLTVLTLAVMIAADLALKYVITTTVDGSGPGEISRERFLYKDFEGGELLKQDIEPDHTISYIVPLQYLAVWQILNNYPGMLSFIFRWGATGITLNHYHKNKKINRIIFWSMISIPLILYLIGKSPDLFNLDPEPWTRPLFRGGNIAIGIMFGLSFLLMARRLPAIKDYLTVTAIGVMIISIAFSVTNLQQTFGIAAHSLVLLSSYLFAIGLYSAAISISHDSTLRKSIRTAVNNTSSDLLQSAGLAETQKRLEQSVLEIAKNQSDNLVQQSGVYPSLKEEDIKRYLEEILPEIQRTSKR